MLDVQERKMRANSETALFFDVLDAVREGYQKRDMWPKDWAEVVEPSAVIQTQYISADEMTAVAKGIVWRAGGAEASAKSAKKLFNKD